MRNLIRVLALALVVGSLSIPVPGAAQTEEPEIYEMIFPVVGGLEFSDNFGDPRGGGRTHAGIDMMAPKMTPVVAVADGVVGWMHDEQGGNCCDMELQHDDGWESWYIHLNNDTEGTDDGLGWGFAEGIEPGARVQAGQVIGYVGDSGNAENSGSHLHFELHEPGGVVINPYPHLLAATVIEEGLPLDFDGAFWDDDGSVHEANIDALAELGVTAGCDESMFCPAEPVTRGQMATFLVRALGWETDSQLEDAFADDDGSPHEANINELAARGVTSGCGEASFCAGEPVTRGQMATFLVAAFGFSDAASDAFWDDNGSVHEPNIDILANYEVTAGCEEGRYCPSAVVTRGQMATFLIRALDWMQPPESVDPVDPEDPGDPGDPEPTP